MSGINNRCAAINCQSTNTVTHRFPKDYERCRIWAERAGCTHLLEKGVEVLNTSYRLCSDHFDDKCYTSTERRRLSNYALPEIFTHDPGIPETEDCDSESRDELTEDQYQISADLLCRVCGCPSDDLVPVFGEKGLEMQLLDKIHTHLPIMVTADDLLPITMCMDCIYKLEMCHEFVHSCLEADAKLRDVLGFSADNEGYNDEYDESQSPLEIKEELDDEDQDTNGFDDSCDNQDSSSHVEHTDVIEISQDEFQNLDSYEQEEYVIEDSADVQLDEAVIENMDEDSADFKSEQSDNDRSQSVETEKPKFKVVVVKMKNTPNMTQDAQIEKALGVLKNVQDTSHSVTEKQHFVDQNTLDQSQEQEQSCLKSSDIELPDGRTVCLFADLSALSLPVLSNEESTAVDVKQEQQASADIYDETVSMVSVKNEVCEEGNALDFARNSPVDHSYTSWDQTMYSCMYCTGTFFGKGNLVSHQTISHPEKVFCCAECDEIIYGSKQFFEEHEKTHLRNSECDEDTLKVNWHMSENSCLKEEKCDVSDNGSISEMIHSTESKIDVEANKARLSERDLKSGIVLPPLEISEQDMASLHREKADTQNDIEIVRVAEIFVEPERSILKKGPIQNVSKFRMKISKNFENIESNVRSEIIGTIRRIIKGSEKERKVLETEGTCQNSEEMQEPTKTVAAWNTTKREIKHKHWKCKLCDHTSVSWEEHRNHVWEHPPVLFPCPCCDKQFHSKARLKCHMFVHTQEKRFICEYCGKGFTSRQCLKNHQYTHDEGEKMFECQDCERKFGTRGGYDSHRASHSEASYLCDLCGKSVKHVSSLRLHRLTHIDPSFFRRHCCAVCGKTCRNRYLLTEHMRVHTNERPYNCTHCGKCFHKRSQLSQHMLIHADARQYICSVCGKGFNRLGNMKVHAKTHEDSSKYMCRICKEIFKSMGQLISHRRTHTKEDIEEAMKQPENQGTEPLVFVCDVCGKQLATKLTLKYHMLIHAGDKPFRCEVCDKRFALKAKLQLHEKIHCSKKPFQCSFCDEGFQTKQYKIIHERIHTGERPYKCMQCTKAFRSKMLLNQHMLVHSDLRPFKCSLCDKSFRRRDTLDTHMRIHTGERPFSCSICGRGFKQKGDCNKHQRTHFKGHKAAVQIHENAGSVTFSCALCGVNFDLKDDLDAHFETYHTTDVVVSSNTMIIDPESLVSVPEIGQDVKAVVLTDYETKCDAS